jgi:hypothetical protein
LGGGGGLVPRVLADLKVTDEAGWLGDLSAFPTEPRRRDVGEIRPSRRNRGRALGCVGSRRRFKTVPLDKRYEHTTDHDDQHRDRDDQHRDRDDLHHRSDDRWYRGDDR